MSTDPREEIDGLIKRALAAPPGSTRQYLPLQERLSEVTGIDSDQIRTKRVADYNVLNNRLGEIASHDAQLLLLLAQTDGDKISDEMVERLAGGLSGWECLVFVRDPRDRWKVARIIEPTTASPRVSDSIHAIYPEAQILRPVDVHRENELRQLIEQWRNETGYPSQHDLDQEAVREDLADLLSSENLKKAVGDPNEFRCQAVSTADQQRVRRSW